MAYKIQHDICKCGGLKCVISCQCRKCRDLLNRRFDHNLAKKMAHDGFSYLYISKKFNVTRVRIGQVCGVRTNNITRCCKCSNKNDRKGLKCSECFEKNRTTKCDKCSTKIYGRSKCCKKCNGLSMRKYDYGQIAYLWNNGLTAKEIAKVVGAPLKAASMFSHRLRKHGYKLQIRGNNTKVY